MGIVLWKIIPIPLLNLLVGGIFCVAGVALAFVPVNDRPLDDWVRNIVKRLNSPTQFTYRKNNPPLYFLQDLFFMNDPHRVMAHIESKEKLAAYLATTTPQAVKQTGKQNVQTLLQQPMQSLQGAQVQPASSTSRTVPPISVQPTVPSMIAQPPKRPFLIGVVKNNKKIPLPGILIYVKDGGNATIRLLKTNPHGIFATYSPLQPGEYAFEVKDPKGGYFFDTMKIRVDEASSSPIEFYSKEML